MDRTRAELLAAAERLSWYHTIDLGEGRVTPGFFDHRPFLAHYDLPEDLSGRTALDIGAASGFFSFELERRGAKVTATDLPGWFDHDFGPAYHADQSAESGREYLHQPFEVARALLGSSVEKRYVNIYDLDPETIGTFDLVFCGSLLLHLTDPIRAFWKIASVTAGRAIVATLMTAEGGDQPMARLIGHETGDSWWAPNRPCLELWAASAGFAGIRWVDEFVLQCRGREDGPLHGVLHAYKTTEGWPAGVVPREEILARYRKITPLTPASSTLITERDRLGRELDSLGRSRYVRLKRWWHDRAVAGVGSA